MRTADPHRAVPSEPKTTPAYLPVEVVTGLATGALDWGGIELLALVDLLEDVLGLDDAGDFFDHLPSPGQEPESAGRT